ncbi:MAG: FG-GAP repeat domain-containing protein [Anaerolineae bacterium]
MLKKQLLHLLFIFLILGGLTACADANAADKPPSEEKTVAPEVETVAPLAAAREDLAQRLDVALDKVTVESVSPTEFPDASLGAPEPGQMYAQVVTPGYVITLTVEGQTYRYHGAGERAVAVPIEATPPPTGQISINGVEASPERVVVRGTSTLPEAACLKTELWADGVPLPWWPIDACAEVADGEWKMVVPLEGKQALQPGVQYMVRAYLSGGPNIVSTFPFDLDGPQASPTRAAAEDPLLLLPDSGEALHRATADLNGDGRAEEIILAGWGGSSERLSYDFLQLFVIEPQESGGYTIAWQSTSLPTGRAEPLQVQDITGDGLPEVLSVQAPGAGGERLYVLAWQGQDYGWLSPQGGHFDGQLAFGENGARTSDLDGDGLTEILASYGPAAAQTDVYAWNGAAYVYQETLSSEEGGYVRVSIAEAGLSLEVPAAWTEIAPRMWAASEESPWRLGVRWVDLRPPQEPEAALLPQPAQILEAEAVEIPWGSGRRFTVEVYGEAEEGAGQAQVQTVETHTLITVEEEGKRRAYDLYVSAPDTRRLRNLESTLQHALASLVLE